MFAQLFWVYALNHWLTLSSVEMVVFDVQHVMLHWSLANARTCWFFWEATWIKCHEKENGHYLYRFNCKVSKSVLLISCNSHNVDYAYRAQTAVRVRNVRMPYWPVDVCVVPCVRTHIKMVLTPMHEIWNVRNRSALGKTRNERAKRRTQQDQMRDELSLWGCGSCQIE